MRSRSPAEISTTTDPRSCSAARCRPRAGRGRSRAGTRSRCRCSRCWPTTWWPCTGSPISSSCSSPGRQRDALDRFGGPELAAALSDYRRVYNRHRAVREELESLTQAERERAAEAETLRLGLAEVEAVAPVAGEDAALLAEEEKLANADALHAAATTAHEALLGDPASASVDGSDAVTLLGTAGRALEAVRAHDPHAGRARRPADRGQLPDFRRGRGARLLHRVAGLRPGPAGRGAGTPGGARPADPGLRGGFRGCGRRARLGQAGRVAAGRARGGQRQDRRAGRGGVAAAGRGGLAGRRS